MSTLRTKISELEERVGEVAGALGALANDKRLMIL
jgi:hypothetical protein